MFPTVWARNCLEFILQMYIFGIVEVSVERGQARFWALEKLPRSRGLTHGTRRGRGRSRAPWETGRTAPGRQGPELGVVGREGLAEGRPDPEVPELLSWVPAGTVRPRAAMPGAGRPFCRRRGGFILVLMGGHAESEVTSWLEIWISVL